MQVYPEKTQAKVERRTRKAFTNAHTFELLLTLDSSLPPLMVCDSNYLHLDNAGK